MYAIYGNIYHQYTNNVDIYTMHGSYGVYKVVPQFGIAFSWWLHKSQCHELVYS